MHDQLERAIDRGRRTVTVFAETTHIDVGDRHATFVDDRAGYLRAGADLDDDVVTRFAGPEPHDAPTRQTRDRITGAHQHGVVAFEIARRDVQLEGAIAAGPQSPSIMPPGISMWTESVPARYCRITTTWSSGVSAITLTQSTASSSENRVDLPVAGCVASTNAVLKIR
jgi:hypothetical protein